MSKEHSSITCIHGMGLACDSCYDQDFGTKFKAQSLQPSVAVAIANAQARQLLVSGQHKTAEYVHPFLNNNTES